MAFTDSAVRVLETSHPPVYYFAQRDVRQELLEARAGSTVCEWKGAASYYDLVVNGQRARRAVWCYRDPTPAFRQIAGWYAFYPALMERCVVDGYTVTAQEGDFYGGWITQYVKGPFKGGPGTRGW